jgi:hypothetical protein
MNRNLVGTIQFLVGQFLKKKRFPSETAYSQMKRNLVGSIYGRSSIKIGHVVPILVGSMHGRVSIKFAQFLFFGWLISKNMFLSETAYSQMNQNLVASIYGRSSKYCSFRYSPLTNMAATGNSCFWLIDF